MNTENPFEVSKLCSGTAQANSPFTSPDMFRVEGDVLVCGHPVVLPRICARGLTNENLVERNALVQFAALRPVLVERRCFVTYFVNKSSARRGLVFFAVSVGVIAAVLFLIATFAKAMGLAPTGVYIPLLLIVAVMLWWKRSPIRLKLVSYEAPGIYRIRGFSQDYLNAISSHVAYLPTHLPSAHRTDQNH